MMMSMEVHARCGSVTGASRFLIGLVLIGLVTCSTTHHGIPAVARARLTRSLVPASGQQQDGRDGAEHHGGES
jgi:hypothetical protein